jgi:hypothetical protein
MEKASSKYDSQQRRRRDHHIPGEPAQEIVLDVQNQMSASGHPIGLPLQNSSLDEIHDMMTHRLDKLPTTARDRQNDSLDLVQVEEEIMPKRSDSPESPVGFNLQRSQSPIFSQYA